MVSLKFGPEYAVCRRQRPHVQWTGTKSTACSFRPVGLSWAGEPWKKSKNIERTRSSAVRWRGGPPTNLSEHHSCKPQTFGIHLPTNERH